MPRDAPVTGPGGDLTVPSGLDLRTLEYFVTVARLLHFGRAAEQLYIRQSTVSQGVRRLEDLLGTELFDRSTRNVTLTSFGQAFLPEARQALAAVTSAFHRGRALAESGSAEIDLGCTPDLQGRMGPALASAQQRSPGTRITATSMPTPAQLRELRAGTLHAGLCWATNPVGDLDHLVVGGARLGLVVPAGHPWASHRAIGFAEAAGEPLITQPRSLDPGLNEHIRQAMESTGIPWTVIATSSGADNIIAQVLSGYGVAMVLDHSENYPSTAGVALLPLKGPGSWVDRILVWPRRPPRSARALQDAVVAAFAHERDARPDR